MANPHHRKKRKHFQPPPHEKKKKGGAASLMSVSGAVIGLIISWFAFDGKIIWVIAGLVAGTIAGYFIGRRIDNSGDGKK